MQHLFNLSLVVILIVGGCSSYESSPRDADKRSAKAQQGFFLPKGDPMAGREVFATMQCAHCHRVEGDTFAAPVASPPIPVALGRAVVAKNRAAIAESIIAPSHRIPDTLKNAKTGSLSRMGDYSQAMTVRELIDLVAYVKSLGS